MSASKIVVIEDEPDIQDVLEYNLTREGFDVRTASTGSEGLRAVAADKPDLVLLDLMIPEIDGLDVCRTLKSEDETKDIPIIMVTAKSEESDVVLGLGLGADDYVQKPFSPRELVARVRAVLRRGGAKKSEPVSQRVRCGPVEVDPSSYRVFLDGKRLSLTPTEFRLLHFMASHPGRVYTRDQLISKAIGEHVVVVDRNIDVHIRSLRKKLGVHRNLIETVRGVGYCVREPEA